MTQKKVGYLVVIIISAVISLYLLAYCFLPENISIIKNTRSKLNIPFPFNIYINSTNDNYGSELMINGSNVTEKAKKYDTAKSITVSSNKIGNYFLKIKLFGFLPLKTVKVNVIPEIRVYPGGQAIGVLLKSKGVMVVGNSFVEGQDGRRYFPGQKAGIEVGDRIVAINGKEVNDKFELLSLIQNYKSQGNLKLSIITKNGHYKTIEIIPVKNKDGNYMIGLYVDDGVAGVGTMTFYDEESREYAALGHLITESTSGLKLEVRKGHIVEANISGFTGGQQGMPGEKMGTFFQTEDILGIINKNNEFGIYGKLIKKPVIMNKYFDKALPIAVRSSVNVGPAHMYTVIEGEKIEEFDIYIEKVYRQYAPAAKSMVIRITDKKLNELTGGIIQGMSGSPIVQNNMLIGAVTHVFVNNPRKGYGVFAEWMIKNTEIYKNNTIAKNAS